MVAPDLDGPEEVGPEEVDGSAYATTDGRSILTAEDLQRATLPNEVPRFTFQFQLGAEVTNLLNRWHIRQAIGLPTVPILRTGQVNIDVPMRGTFDLDPAFLGQFGESVLAKMEERAKADVAARTLLMNSLSKFQQDQLTQYGGFAVLAPSGTWYVIGAYQGDPFDYAYTMLYRVVHPVKLATNHYYEFIYGDGFGCGVTTLCFQPVEDMPNADRMSAWKLYIEAYEDFLVHVGVESILELQGEHAMVRGTAWIRRLVEEAQEHAAS